MNFKTSSLLLWSIVLSNLLQAQYGTFDAKRVTAAKGKPTNVVLDNGDSQFNKTMMEGVKANWEFGTYEFIKQGDIGASGFLPETLYLLKTQKTDPKTFTTNYLTLVEGWKMKKGQTIETNENSITNIPAEQELASILIDPKAMEENSTGALNVLYVKHLQDYLSNVLAGKITDKTTADRTYSGRTRLIRGGKLLMADTHLDKTVATAEAAAAFYTSDMSLGTKAALMAPIKEQDKTTCITDVVITGDHKTKYCFKRIFNASTGELMFQSETPALYGKKEGFLDEDLKDLERAR